ncbi:MAG: putative rane protein [Acidobacteriota bacterium]|nr:putative rane protein [Acidobacteriota bacterium]
MSAIERRIAESEGRAQDVAKGLMAGMIGGFVASLVMNQFQQASQKLIEGEERGHGAQSMQQGAPRHGAGEMLRERGVDSSDDDATERTASAISVGVFDHELTKSEKEGAGTAVHYAFGTGTGAFYGAAAELAPALTTGAGAPFGAAVWLAADEGLVPLLGLSKSPTEYPVSTHLYSLASHFVYGLTTELVRRVVRDRL